MAKQKKTQKYGEADLIRLFGLERTKTHIPLMEEWVNNSIELSPLEKELFEEILQEAYQKIEAWNEEALKMKFISFVLKLGHLHDTDNYSTYFEQTISATIDGIFLKTQTDFMVAKGILDKPQTPYFHFQEYKKLKAPYDDPVAQLIEAFLIAQALNQNNKPIYGCTITSKFWDFFVMDSKTYCISKSYDCTERDELLQIIAILRKFKEILETRLLD
jgi:hypothetical protein